MHTGHLSAGTVREGGQMADGRWQMTTAANERKLLAVSDVTDTDTDSDGE